jgi:serine/threonine protein phosphatase PrpC
MLQSFGLSDPGLVRTSNQDRILLDSALGLFLIADGVGGQSHGEAAAEIAISSGQYYVRASRDSFDVSWPFGYDVNRSLNENRLMTAIQLANRQLCTLKATSPDHAGSGSTLVGVLVEGPRLAVGNVGDSRVYMLREGVLRQLSIDDTWVAQLVRGGAITEAQARSHSMRHVVTQAVGIESIEVHTCEEQLEDNDMVLLTTDGVHGVLEHAVLCSILSNCRSLEDGVKRLIEAALDQGGPDNASCILVRYNRDGSQG